MSRKKAVAADAAGEERLVVGLVRGIHGLRGALRVEVLTDDPTRFEAGREMYPEGERRLLRVESSQEDGPGLLVRFEGIDTREAADSLRDRYLEASTAGTTLEEGAVYWHELMDVPVTTAEGEKLGVVRDIFRAGGGEVLVVREGPRGEILIPTVRSVVLEFAPREGRVVVDREALDLDPEPKPRKPRGRRTTRALKAGRPAPFDAPAESAADPPAVDPPAESTA